MKDITLKTAVVLLSPNFEEIEAISPIDLLRRAGIKVTSLGLAGIRIAGAHQIVVEADMAIEQYQELPDCVVIPGGPGCAAIAKHPLAATLIKAVHQKGGVVAAICAAPGYVLAPLGILEAKRYTGFPGCEAKNTTAQYFKKAVLIDGQIITSLAAGTSAEFAEAIIHTLVGDRIAREVAESTFQHWVRFD